MGVLDPAALDRMVERTMSGSGEVHVPEVDADFTYDDAPGTTFQVLAASDSYRRNAETGGWTDMSDDDSFMACLLYTSLVEIEERFGVDIAPTAVERSEMNTVNKIIEQIAVRL